jgi:hypothetical protein
MPSSVDVPAFAGRCIHALESNCACCERAPGSTKTWASRPIQTSISGRVVVGVPQEHAARRIRVIRVGLLRWRRISVASTLWAVASIFYEQLAWLFFVVRVVKPWSVSSHTASADESRLTSGVNGESRPAS